MKRVLRIFLYIIISGSLQNLSAVSQDFTIFQNDTINRIDLNNLKQGTWKIFGKDKKLDGFSDEQLFEEGTYIDNRKIGIWKKYFANGKLQNEITYKNGRPNGFAKIYYTNGILKEEGIWKGNKWTGDYKYYYENGTIYHEFAYNEKGKRSGPQKYYYETGQVMIEGEWLEGKESGILKEYYADGSVKSEKFFNNGAIDPESTITYEQEKPEEKPTPEPVGKGVVVEKGETTRTIVAFDGTGYHKLYNKNRLISKDGVFKNNKLMDGKWYRYNNDGILQKIEVFRNGIHIGEAQIEEEE
jgi:antitoxin component YwqK of YwqJK toxin-antitoxin module